MTVGRDGELSEVSTPRFTLSDDATDLSWVLESVSWLVVDPSHG